MGCFLWARKSESSSPERPSLRRLWRLSRSHAHSPAWVQPSRPRQLLMVPLQVLLHVRSQHPPRSCSAVRHVRVEGTEVSSLLLTFAVPHTWHPVCVLGI